MGGDFDKSSVDEFGLLSAFNRAMNINDELSREKDAELERLGHLLSNRISKAASNHLSKSSPDGLHCVFEITAKFPVLEKRGQTNRSLAIVMPLLENEGTLPVTQFDPEEAAWRSQILFVHPAFGREISNVKKAIESLLSKMPIASFVGSGATVNLTLGELLGHTENLLNSSTDDQLKTQIEVVFKHNEYTTNQTDSIPLSKTKQWVEEILDSGIIHDTQLPSNARNADHQHVQAWLHHNSVTYGELAIGVTIDYTDLIQ